eukprot:2643239-Pyramimonas_sp.AAC.1
MWELVRAGYTELIEVRGGWVPLRSPVLLLHTRQIALAMLSYCTLDKSLLSCLSCSLIAH